MWISDVLVALAVATMVWTAPLALRVRLRVWMLITGCVLWPSAWSVVLSVVGCDWVLGQVARRQQRIAQDKGFRAYWPWLVDLMRIAIAGGAAHGVAFDHAITALKESPLKTFGQHVFGRRQEGQDRVAAIIAVGRDMGSREALDLGLAMRESARQGSDLSPLLIEQARALRERTQRRLERAANGLSVKLLIPLVICFFPMFFLVLAFTIFHSLGRLPWST